MHANTLDRIDKASLEKSSIRGYPLLYFNEAYFFIKFMRKHDINLICQYFGFDFGELYDDIRIFSINEFANIFQKYVLFKNTFECSKNSTTIEQCNFPTKL